MLSRLNLGTKLLLLVLPFALLTFVLAGWESARHLGLLRQMEASRQLVSASTAASGLVDALQTERGLTNGFLSGSSSLPAPLAEARGKTDDALKVFRTLEAQTSHPELAQRMTAAAGMVEGLQQARSSVDRRTAAATEAFGAYTRAVEALVNLVSDVQTVSDEPGLIRAGSALTHLMCVKEYAGRERGFVNGALATGSISPAALRQAVTLQAQQTACLEQFVLQAPEVLQVRVRSELDAPEMGAVLPLRNAILGAEPGATLTVTPADWFRVSSARIARLKAAQDLLLADLADQVATEVQAARTRLMVIAGGTLLLLVGLGLAGVAVYRSIRRPVVALENMMSQMAASLDLGPRARLAGTDEVARMGAAFDHLVDAFADTLQVVKRNAHQLMDAVADLQRVSGRAATTAEAQSTSSTGIAAAIEQMSVGMNVVSDNTRESLDVAQQMQRGVTSGRTRMHETTRALEETSHSVAGAGDLIGSLAQKSQNIRQIITAIREIADQTNLLALNAAIEAARAGELGRGFAVVADEVRKLAERTGKETVEIAQLIEAITGETQNAASRMSTARTQMESGMTLVTATLGELDALYEEARQTAEKSQATALAMQEQTAASNEVAVNISRIASLAEDNSAIVQEAARLASALNATAHSLVDQVDRFHHTSGS